MEASTTSIVGAQQNRSGLIRQKDYTRGMYWYVGMILYLEELCVSDILERRKKATACRDLHFGI